MSMFYSHICVYGNPCLPAVHPEGSLGVERNWRWVVALAGTLRGALPYLLTALHNQAFVILSDNIQCFSLLWVLALVDISTHTGMIDGNLDNTFFAC